MSSTAKTYCRLCAELKPFSKLVNLQTEKEKCEDIILKLKRFHINVNLNDNIWPITICFACTDSLKYAFDFVIAVEEAQITLNKFAVVKQEVDSDHENITYEPSAHYNKDDIKNYGKNYEENLSVTNEKNITLKHIKIEEEDIDLNHKKMIEFKVNSTIPDTSIFANRTMVNQHMNLNNVKKEIHEHSNECENMFKNQEDIDFNNKNFIEFKVDSTISSTSNFTNEIDIENENIVSPHVNLNNVKNEMNEHDFNQHSNKDNMLHHVAQHTMKDENHSNHGNIIYEPPAYYNEDNTKNDKMILANTEGISNENYITLKQIKSEEQKDDNLNSKKIIEFTVNSTITDTSNFASENIVSRHMYLNNVDNGMDGHNFSQHSDVEDEYMIGNKDNNMVDIGLSHDEDEEKEKGISKNKPSASKVSENIDDSQVKQQIDKLASCPVSAIKKTWTEYNWKCAYCETLFVNIDELRSHSMQYHEACNPYQCTDCKKRTIHLDRFLKHVKEHRRYLHYSCYKCNVKVSNLKQASKHKATHNISKYICRGCNTNFLNENDFNEHENKFFKNMFITQVPEQLQSDNLTCKICKWTSKCTSAFKKHVSRHTDRPRDYTCETCGKGFYSKLVLKNHMIVHTTRLEYQCEVCNSVFKSANNLAGHASMHSGEKPYACDQCGKCFRTKYLLKNHKIIHTDILPHVCSYCNERFRFKPNLNRHLRKHTKKEPYSCVVCQRKINDLTNFYKHLRCKHGIDKEHRHLFLDVDRASKNDINSETN